MQILSEYARKIIKDVMIDKIDYHDCDDPEGKFIFDTDLLLDDFWWSVVLGVKKPT